jgi:hypothetical protein
MKPSQIRTLWGVLTGVLLLSAILIPASEGFATENSSGPIPIFDAHVHFSRPDWSQYAPEAVVRILQESHVYRALISSTPDEGTLRLYGTDPARFVPILRPYRDGVGSGNWMYDAETPAYIASRLTRGASGAAYRGIGEFHLFETAHARTPVLRKVARMAVEKDLFLNVHADIGPVAALFEIEPRAKILWAHAGMVTPPGEIRRMLETHKRLWAGLSFRAGDILRGGKIDPQWKALLLDHSGRFLVASDTYVTSRWGEYASLIAAHRSWLALLPPQAARAIAYRNAARLFGSGGIAALER